MSINREAKKKIVCIAMADKDYERIVKQAYKLDMTVSAFIRLCIKKEFERGSSRK